MGNYVAVFCLFVFVCASKGKDVSPVSKIARINREYGADHVIDMDIQPRFKELFHEDDVMSAAPRHETITWPGGFIPYELDRVFEKTSRLKRLVEVAMKKWERNTCVKFKERSSEAFFLRIYHGKGCRAEVGFYPGVSVLSLGRRCTHLPIVLHELGHVIGFWHEQNRPDRDNYVQILWTNINRDFFPAFKKYTSRKINSNAVPYDFYSVMHYGMHSFTKNGGVTIRPRDPSVRRLGGSRLSELDIKQTNVIYNCGKRRKHHQKWVIHAGINMRDGGWANWSPWRPCSRRCGGGVEKRTRLCTRTGGLRCKGSPVQTRKCNIHGCFDWPQWASDFKFGIYPFASEQNSCVRIYERRQYFQWRNYRLCWSNKARRLRLRWSDSGVIKGMRCTQVSEKLEEKSWNDNFLCVDRAAPYNFTWSSTGPIRGLHCLEFRAKQGLDGWNDNYLCATQYPQKT